MLRLLPVVVYIGFIVFCLIDCIQTPEEEVRNLPKVVWVILILLFEIIGSVAWLVAGRPQRRRAATAGWPAPRAGSFPEYQRPRATMAPDDDPEFLRTLKSTNDDHERLLKKWEDDLKRREGELRDDQPDDGSAAPKP